MPQSRKVMRAGVMKTKGGDGFAKICGRKNWQDLVIIWIYGVKTRWPIKTTPTFVTSVIMDADIKEGVGVRRKDTVF